MIRVPTNRTPTHPGEMLLEDFLVPMGLTQRELADAIHVPYQRINDLVNGRRGMTPGTALRLAKYLVFMLLRIDQLKPHDGTAEWLTGTVTPGCRPLGTAPPSWPEVGQQ